MFAFLLVKKIRTAAEVSADAPFLLYSISF